MKENKRKKLYHTDEKRSPFYSMPIGIMCMAFEALGNHDGNEIKVFTVLLGNLGDGTYVLSDSFIHSRMGLSRVQYQRALKKLVEHGFVSVHGDRVVLDIADLAQRAEAYLPKPKNKAA